MSCPACNHPRMKLVYRYRIGKPANGKNCYKCPNCGNILTENSHDKRGINLHTMEYVEDLSFPRVVLKILLLFAGIIAATMLILFALEAAIKTFVPNL